MVGRLWKAGRGIQFSFRLCDFQEVSEIFKLIHSHPTLKIDKNVKFINHKDLISCGQVYCFNSFWTKVYEILLNHEWIFRAQAVLCSDRTGMDSGEAEARENVTQGGSGSSLHVCASHEVHCC